MRGIVASLLHDLGLPSLLASVRIKNRELSVLLFHRISDDCDPLWPPLPVATFRVLMEELSRKTRVVKVEDISRLSAYPDKPLVVLSFDDGYVDFLDNALPVLDELGMPAHHNICPGLIDSSSLPWSQKLQSYVAANHRGELILPDGAQIAIRDYFSEMGFLQLYEELRTYDPSECERWIDALDGGSSAADSAMRLMDWDQIRECARAGVSIGAHGLYHRILTDIDSSDKLREEVEGCRSRIEEETGRLPSVFAFPYGIYDARCLEQVRRSGYATALLCENKVRVWPAAEECAVLPRIGIARNHWKEELLRALGFHQKVSYRLRGRSYLY